MPESKKPPFTKGEDNEEWELDYDEEEGFGGGSSEEDEDGPTGGEQEDPGRTGD